MADSNIENKDELLKIIEEKTTKLLETWYSKGLAEGGKTFVASIYQSITSSEQDGKKTAEEIIEDVKKLCIRYFNTNENYLNAENRQTIEEVVNIMNMGE